MSRRRKIFIVAMLALLVAGSFYLRTLVHRTTGEKASQENEAVRARLKEIALQSPHAKTQDVTLYFPSLDRRELVPEKRPMVLAESDTDRIRQILLALIEGSHQGSNPVLPPSTEVRAVFLTSDGTAYIDFSSDIRTDFNPGIASETLAVYSIVDSLSANIPSVRRVKILIQGKEVQTLDGHVDLTNFFIPDPSRIESGP